MQNASTVSKFIVDKIKTTPWKKRAYINDLLQLRSWIINGPTGFISGQHYWRFRNKYPQEYLALLQEHSPEKYQQELMRREETLLQNWNRLKEQKAQKQSEAEKDLEEYEEWLAIGGLAS